MPTYAYACKSCGHRFDAVQAFTDSTLTACPECGGVLRKQYGSIGVTFNGSGFYRTDSRSGDAKAAAGKPSGSSDGSGSSGKSDSGSSSGSGTKSDSGSSSGGGSSSSSSGSTSGTKSSPASTGS